MQGYLENFNIGDEVEASFTNTGRILRFKGRIIGRTKNYWKVESLVSVWPGEDAGRMFHIATMESRIWSVNNRILGKVE